MTRAGDRTPPTLAGPRPPPRPGWGAELYVGIERVAGAGYAWDDLEAAWDAPGFVWDGTGTGSTMLDATCDVAGVEIERGSSDLDGRMDAGRAVVTLRNDTGAWSQWDSFGRLVNYEPGSRVDIWARTGGADYWLFSGVVTAWREQTSGMVEVEAFDPSGRLNETAGTEWIPGTVGQRPDQRIASILTVAGYTGPTRLNAGRATLHAYATTASPLEELQAVAVSDGGLVGFDADGTLVYRDRSWPGGRADQTTVVTFSDNLPTADAVVWDLELVTDDEMTATVVHLENVDGLAVEARATGLHPSRYDRAGDLWRTVLEGQELATYTIARRVDQYLRIDGFTLHLHDPLQDLWRVGVDLRIGDVVRFVRDQTTTGGSTTRLDLNLVAAAVSHSITPDAWTIRVETTRAVGQNVAHRWDGPGVHWDDPAVAWGY